MRVASDGVLPGSDRSRFASTYRPRTNTATAMQTASNDKVTARMQLTSGVQRKRQRSGRESDPTAETDHADPQRDRQPACQPCRARWRKSLVPLQDVTIGAEVEHRHVHARQEHAQELQLELQ